VAGTIHIALHKKHNKIIKQINPNQTKPNQTKPNQIKPKPKNSNKPKLNKNPNQTNLCRVVSGASSVS
jgi:hypothetical protein